MSLLMHFTLPVTILSESILNHIFTPEKRLDAVFRSFDSILFVLDRQGRIMDFKNGNGSSLDPSFFKGLSLKFQDFVPVEAGRKYEHAVRKLHSNGNRFVLFDFALDLLTSEVLCESCLVPFTDDQNIMFVWNVTKKRVSPPDHELTADDRLIENWCDVLQLRDRETQDHTRRVTELTLRLSRRMGIPDAELIHMRQGAVLHDIGKVAIPDSILFKPGPLTDEEWEIMRRHPVIAVEILNPASHLAPALPIPRSHHEKWDGSGYPDGLAGEQIPLSARIFAFADVYDALTSDRPYRSAWSQTEALDYIQKQAGTHFDPSIAPVFIAMFSN
jgi:HD-GYP domain-containing protein (c-di-GMP phosphodiesterase class II)